MSLYKQFEVTKETFAGALNALADDVCDHETIYLSYSTEKPKKKYTQAQRGSLHIWCDWVAKTFNDAGMVYGSRVKFNGEHVSIDWNMKLVKDDVYKPLLEAMTGKVSTEDQDTINPQSVVNELCRHFAEKHSITLPPWPSR